MCRRREIDRVSAGPRLQRAIAAGAQNVAKQLHVHLVVLDDENVLTCHRYTDLTGSVKTNVLPVPTSLSTQILPP